MPPLPLCDHDECPVTRCAHVPGVALNRAGSAPVIVGTFVDEIDACTPEEAFWRALDDGGSPFRTEGHPHHGEGGSTTACFQGGKLVGITSRIRDELNRTILLRVDLREQNTTCSQPGKPATE